MRTDGYIELEIYYVELTGHIASFMNLSNLFSVKPVVVIIPHDFHIYIYICHMYIFIFIFKYTYIFTDVGQNWVPQSLDD